MYRLLPVQSRGGSRGGGGGGGGAPGAGAPPLCFFITLFSSLLTCCRYAATPGLASSARNIVRCLKPNGLGTRPRSSIPLCVRTYYVREPKFEQGRSSWRPWDLQSSYIWNLQCKARRCHIWNLQCKARRCHESPYAS